MPAEANALPFLFQHGPWIWKVALVVLTVGSVASVVVITRLRAGSRARKAVRELQRSEHVVHGTLRGHSTIGAAVATLDAELSEYADTPPSEGPLISSSWSANGIWLETKDGKVTFDGEVAVLAGSSARVTRRGVPFEIGDAHLEAAMARASWVHREGGGSHKTQRGVLRRLRVGDEVVAAGILTAVAASEATGYRENASVMALRPPDNKPIVLAAVRPAGELLRPSIVKLGLLAALVACVGYAGSKKLGKGWVRDCFGDYDDKRPIVVDNTHACSLAAATPGGQHRAFVELLDRFDRVSPHDARSRALVQVLSTRVESCDKRIERHMNWFEYGAAAALARSCNNRRAEHLALISDARFDEASAIEVPADDEGDQLPTIQTLLAAGRWNDAALRVDAVLATYKPKDNNELDGASQRVAYACFADMLRHHAGDPRAAARIRTRFEGEHGTRCTVMALELMSPAERDAFFTDRNLFPLALRNSTTLAWAAGYPISSAGLSTPIEALLKPDDMRVAHELFRAWLATLHRDRILAQPAADTVEALSWLAVKDTFDGRIEAARENARRAVTGLSESTDRISLFHDRDVPHLESSILFYTPATDLPVDFEAPVPNASRGRSLVELGKNSWLHNLGRLLLRDGQPIDAAYFGPDDDYKAALVDAQQGDGLALARRIASGRNSWWTAGDIAAVLPRVKTHRAELVDAIQHTLRSWRQTNALEYGYPFSLAGIAVERRVMFQLAGLAAEAKRWDDMYRRVDAVLSDRKKLIALFAWTN